MWYYDILCISGVEWALFFQALNTRMLRIDIQSLVHVHPKFRAAESQRPVIWWFILREKNENP